MKVHPFADTFPMLPDDELKALADDIAANGQRFPIMVNKDGVLIDGRNRLVACERRRIKPWVETFTGDPYAYIVSANTHRRNLNAGQVAMARAIALVAQGQRENGRWKHKNVSNDTSSRMSMYRAGFILDHDPAAASLVFAGSSLTSVYETVKDTVEGRNEQKRQADELLSNAPDLASLVAEEGLDHKTAWARYIAQQTKAELDARERDDADRKRWQKTADAVRVLFNITGPWMDGYDPDEQADTTRYFTTDTLLAARDQLDALIEWSKAR